MEDEDEEEEEEDIEADPYVGLRTAEGQLKVDESDRSPGPSCPVETLQPPDEEKAGLELLILKRDAN